MAGVLRKCSSHTTQRPASGCVGRGHRPVFPCASCFFVNSGLTRPRSQHHQSSSVPPFPADQVQPGWKDSAAYMWTGRRPKPPGSPSALPLTECGRQFHITPENRIAGETTAGVHAATAHKSSQPHSQGAPPDTARCPSRGTGERQHGRAPRTTTQQQKGRDFWCLQPCRQTSRAPGQRRKPGSKTAPSGPILGHSGKARADQQWPGGGLGSHSSLRPGEHSVS